MKPVLFSLLGFVSITGASAACGDQVGQEMCGASFDDKTSFAAGPVYGYQWFPTEWSEACKYMCEMIQHQQGLVPNVTHVLKTSGYINCQCMTTTGVCTNPTFDMSLYGDNYLLDVSECTSRKPQACAANKRANDGKCEDCPFGWESNGVDDPYLTPNTECTEMQNCETDHYASNGACEECAQGKYRYPGDYPHVGDTQCGDCSVREQVCANVDDQYDVPHADHQYISNDWAANADEFNTSCQCNSTQTKYVSTVNKNFCWCISKPCVGRRTPSGAQFTDIFRILECGPLPPTCEGFSECSAGTHHLKNNTESIYCNPNSVCQVSDCCDPNPTCEGYSECSAGTHHLKDAAESITCTSTTCQASECCDANPTCAGYSECSAGTHHLKDAAGSITCASGACEASECCDPNPTCEGYSTCNAGTHHLKDAAGSITCASGACEASDCCDANPTCAGYSECSAGTHHLKDAAGSITCANGACEASECCDANPTCAGYSECSSGTQHLKDAAGSITCASGACEASECCDGNPTCTGYSECSAGTHHLKDAAGSITCASTTCQASECCDANPTCAEYLGCNSDTHHLKDAAGSITCASSACEGSECCDANAPATSCFDVDCNNYGGYKPTAGPCDLANGECTEANCCSFSTQAAFNTECESHSTADAYLSARCCDRTVC